MGKIITGNNAESAKPACAKYTVREIHEGKLDLAQFILIITWYNNTFCWPLVFNCFLYTKQAKFGARISKLKQ